MRELAELNRIKFVFKRDGDISAKAFAKQIILCYLASVRYWKTKPGGRKHPYRGSYIESAISCRYLLKNWELISE